MKDRLSKLAQERDMFKDRYNQLRSNAQQSGLASTSAIPISAQFGSSVVDRNLASMDDLHYARQPNFAPKNTQAQSISNLYE
jgi:hypothetical protein